MAAVPGSYRSTNSSDPLDTIDCSGDLWNGVDPATLQVGIDPSSYLGSGVSGYSLAILAELDLHSLTGLYSAVKNQQTNLAQMIAEKSQTAKLLVGSVTRLVSVLIDLKHGRLSSAARTLFPGNPTGVSQDWLMYQYGVKPLINDINGIVDTFAKEEHQIFDVKKGSKRSLSLILEDTDVSYGVCRAHVRVKLFSQVEVKYKTRLQATFVTRSLAKLGFGNPAQLGWELFPYSFVMDWFIPVGNYIANVDAFAGLIAVFTTKTTYINEVVTIERTFGGNALFGFKCSGGSSNVTMRKTYCRREILDVAPPLPYPNFKNPFSMTHALNALALLITSKRK
jgi:hypothetical protein